MQRRLGAAAIFPVDNGQPLRHIHIRLPLSVVAYLSDLTPKVITATQSSDEMRGTISYMDVRQTVFSMSLQNVRGWLSTRCQWRKTARMGRVVACGIVCVRACPLPHYRVPTPVCVLS